MHQLVGAAVGAVEYSGEKIRNASAEGALDVVAKVELARVRIILRALSAAPSLTRL